MPNQTNLTKSKTKLTNFFSIAAIIIKISEALCNTTIDQNSYFTFCQGKLDCRQSERTLGYGSNTGVDRECVNLGFATSKTQTN